MSNDVRARITAFVDKIIEADITPRAAQLAAQPAAFKCGELLQGPLPLDTSSNPTTRTLLPQLLTTVGHGTDDDAFYKAAVSCVEGDVQHIRILSASAASGVGKTHLAYSIGSSLMYALVMRVAEQFESGGEPRMSLPWVQLIFHLAEYDKLRERLEKQDDVFNLATDAYKLIELLILSYVDVTVTALEQAQRSGRSVADLRELALRFNRNGRAEEIVQLHFQQLRAAFTEDTAQKSAATAHQLSSQPSAPLP